VRRGGAARRAAAAFVVAAVAAAAVPARAADADAYNAALTRAIAAKERALDVNEPPRWEEALRLFQEAAAIRETRECAYEIGFAAERLSRTDLAVEAYQAALDLGLVGPARARAGTFVSAHAAALAQVEVRGAPGTRLRVAGVERGRLPLTRPLVLFPGSVEIEAVDPAGRTVAVAVHLQAGLLERVNLPAATAGAPAPEAAPAAASPPAPQVPAPAAGAVTPGTGATPGWSPSPRESEDQPTTSAAAWPLIITGAVIAAGAAVLIPVSGGRIDDDRSALAAECTTPPTGDVCAVAYNGQRAAAQSHEDGIATWKGVRLGAWIGLGVGVATLGTGLVLKLREPAAPPITPALVLDAGGRPSVALAWRFRF
jgi:hypothetical protein